MTKVQSQPIGLDIGQDSIKMMQLEVAGSSLSVAAGARRPIPTEAREHPELHAAAAMDLIRQLFRQAPFHGRRIVTALPSHIVQVKNLRLPNIPPVEIARAVEFEARNIFPFDIDQAHIEYLHAGEVRQNGDVRQEVIVMAAKNEDVNNFMEQLHRCGVVVESLDVEPCALYRMVERFIRRREDENEVNVLVDVGLRRTQVVIGRGSDISFFKTIDIGGARLDDAVSRKLSISMDEARALRHRTSSATEGQDAKRDPVQQAMFDATRSVMEELGREVSLCLRYYSVTFRGQRPSKVRLLGDDAGDVQLQGVMQSILTIPVEAGRPLYSVDVSRMNPSDRSGPMSDWAVAMGLSLKRTTGRFGAKDGKPRDHSSAEVVDVNAAVVAAPEKAAEKQEAVHA